MPDDLVGCCCASAVTDPCRSVPGSPHSTHCTDFTSPSPGYCSRIKSFSSKHNSGYAAPLWGHGLHALIENESSPWAVVIGSSGDMLLAMGMHRRDQGIYI